MKELEKGMVKGVLKLMDNGREWRVCCLFCASGRRDWQDAQKESFESKSK